MSYVMVLALTHKSISEVEMEQGIILSVCVITGTVDAGMERGSRWHGKFRP